MSGRTGEQREEPWPAGPSTRVAVQERRRLLRSGIALVLGAEQDIEVVGTAADDLGIRNLVDGAAVDAVVLEVRPGTWDVGELVGALRRRHDSLLVVGVHSGRRSDHVAATRGVDIDVLLPMSAGTSGLLAAVRGGGAVEQKRPKVDRRVLPGREILTAREKEVLRHISAGLTTQQSAQLLELSPKTVDNHKQRMFAKLGVQSQAHAVAVAHRVGILRPDHQRAFGA